MPEATKSDLDLTEIDEISAPKVEPEEPSDQPNVPGHLQRHECGLWEIFVRNMTIDDDDGHSIHYVAKKELIQYLQDHGIDHDDRKNLQVTDTERRLYDIYTGVQRQNRVSKEHFVAALRLCHHGKLLWPKKTINLNDMKVL